ncbi:hypothetical protein KW841_20185 [Pseudomonas sp. PDM28]|jgi:hypothetical protein|nr:hypothetical protein [Pseudomonas sp. PDM28]MBV7554668.1 hypothetical protein [Pseudomonas sp. PDM28]
MIDHMQGTLRQGVVMVLEKPASAGFFVAAGKVGAAGSVFLPPLFY